MLLTNRLQIFVSSTIKECAKERDVARSAIKSINHEPVLFEDVGARPFPPRELYKSRIEAAHVFVAIYRLEYGWVAPDTEISGVDDEFQIASDLGKEILVYVFEGEGDRDAKLQALVERTMEAGVSVAFYNDPTELHDRIRDDLTAVVSGQFVQHAAAGDKGPGAAELIEAFLPNTGHRLRRPEVEALVLGSVQSVGRTLIVGPLGAGKSVLLAQLAERHDWVFVDGGGLNALDLLARTANALRARLGEGAATFLSEQAARAEVEAAWERATPVTLALDAPVSPALLWHLPDVPENHLVVTARQSDSDIPAAQRVQLPALTAAEVESWLTAFRGGQPEPGEVAELTTRSLGNPLYLRFYALGGADGTSDLSLQGLEIQAYRALSPQAQEVLFYLALAGKPLSLGTLAQVLGSDVGGPESVAGLIEEAAALVRQSSGEAGIIHEHPQRTLLDQLTASPTRLGFFAGHLGGYFEDTGDYVAAFRVFDLAGERRRADLVLDRASQQTLARGGGADAIGIFRRRAEKAGEDDRTEDQVQSLLALAQALAQTGDRAQAIEVLGSAEAVAASSGLDQLGRQVRAIGTLLDFEELGHVARVASLLELHQEYSELGLDFDATRTNVLLAAEYIGAHEFELARDSARSTLEYFESVGDEYGRRISQMNLAVALIGIDSGDPDALRMARELEEFADPKEHPRERAVICNLLTRRYRGSGDYALAAGYAGEAIRIGESLEDQHVIGINRVNLGNVRRDEGKMDEALAEYRAADLVAVAAGLAGDEAVANRLIATALNRMGDHELALSHARHAAGLARSTDDPLTLGLALKETAMALALSGQEEEAIGNFTAATQAIAGLESAKSQFRSLIEDGLSYCEASQQSELKLEFLKGALGSTDASAGDFEQGLIEVLRESLPEIVCRMGVERSPAMIALAVSDFLTDMPGPVGRHVIRLCIDSLLGSGAEVEDSALSTGVAGLLMACSWDSLEIGDLVDFADRLSSRIPGLNFKPHLDGAAHWTLHLVLGGAAIVSVQQLDDSSRSAVVALVIVLLLLGLDDVVTELVLQTENAPRREATIWVVGRGEFEAHVDSELVDLGNMESGFVVTHSTNVTHGEQPPTLVVCADDFGRPWQPTQERLSDLQLLFAELLRALTGHFLASEVEDEVLRPKVQRLLRRIGYRGRDWSRTIRESPLGPGTT